jgi:hypothetical protein
MEVTIPSSVLTLEFGESAISPDGADVVVWASFSVMVKFGAPHPCGVCRGAILTTDSLLAVFQLSGERQRSWKRGRATGSVKTHRHHYAWIKAY